MMLYWLVLVPILMLILMVPRLALALARLGVTVQDSYGDAAQAYASTALDDVIPVVGGLLFAVGIVNTMTSLSRVGTSFHSEFDFLKFRLSPFIGAAAAFIT